MEPGSSGLFADFMLCVIGALGRTCHQIRAPSVIDFDERNTLNLQDIPHSPLHTTHDGLHTRFQSSGYDADRYARPCTPLQKQLSPANTPRQPYGPPSFLEALPP